MTDYDIALNAAKQVAKRRVTNNYATGAKTIRYREPTPDSFWCVSLYSWDFARHAECSVAAARRRLSVLADSNKIYERPRDRNVREWRLFTWTAEKVMRKAIDELRAEGLPFDDEWRAAGRPKTWPPKEKTP